MSPIHTFHFIQSPSKLLGNIKAQANYLAISIAKVQDDYCLAKKYFKPQDYYCLTHNYFESQYHLASIIILFQNPETNNAWQILLF